VTACSDETATARSALLTSNAFGVSSIRLQRLSRPLWLQAT
jgi:hypothetical protein